MLATLQNNRGHNWYVESAEIQVAPAHALTAAKRERGVRLAAFLQAVQTQTDASTHLTLRTHAKRHNQHATLLPDEFDGQFHATPPAFEAPAHLHGSVDDAGPWCTFRWWENHNSCSTSQRAATMMAPHTEGPAETSEIEPGSTKRPATPLHLVLDDGPVEAVNSQCFNEGYPVTCGEGRTCKSFTETESWRQHDASAGGPQEISSVIPTVPAQQALSSGTDQVQPCITHEVHDEAGRLATQHLAALDNLARATQTDYATDIPSAIALALEIPTLSSSSYMHPPTELGLELDRPSSNSAAAAIMTQDAPSYYFRSGHVDAETLPVHRTRQISEKTLPAPSDADQNMAGWSHNDNYVDEYAMTTATSSTNTPQPKKRRRNSGSSSERHARPEKPARRIKSCYSCCMGKKKCTFLEGATENASCRSCSTAGKVCFVTERMFHDKRGVQIMSEEQLQAVTVQIAKITAQARKLNDKRAELESLSHQQQQQQLTKETYTTAASRSSNDAHYLRHSNTVGSLSQQHGAQPTRDFLQDDTRRPKRKRVKTKESASVNAQQLDNVRDPKTPAEDTFQLQVPIIESRHLLPPPPPPPTQTPAATPELQQPQQPPTPPPPPAMLLPPAHWALDEEHGVTINVSHHRRELQYVSPEKFFNGEMDVSLFGTPVSLSRAVSDALASDAVSKNLDASINSSLFKGYVPTEGSLPLPISTPNGTELVLRGGGTTPPPFTGSGDFLSMDAFDVDFRAHQFDILNHTGGTCSAVAILPSPNLSPIKHVSSSFVGLPSHSFPSGEAPSPVVPSIHSTFGGSNGSSADELAHAARPAAAQPFARRRLVFSSPFK
jgi:hypothetical protein